MDTIHTLYTAIKDAIVSKRNALRFNMPMIMQNAIMGADSRHQAADFIQVTMEVSRQCAIEIVKRVHEGETFISVTNDMNVLCTLK